MFAQAGSSVAQLNGTVHDPANGSVPHATVSLREINTNQTHSTTSNDVGFYVATNLPAGQYELTVQAVGFAKLVLSGIVLRVGQVATIDVRLTMKTREEHILVTGKTPALEPSRTETSQGHCSSSARYAFKQQQPCPATGSSTGSCPGYVIDHIKPLACGGADDPSNMQWQTRKAAKAKDSWELDGCEK